MTTECLPCVERGARDDAVASVVWLHGLGADGHDFAPIVPELGLDRGWRVRFVFPHAPAIPVSINAGFVMPAWYDITEADLRRRHDEAGIRASAAHIEALLARERARGVPSEHTVLAGFSQGGAMALHVATRHGQRLAGAIGLSCYLVGDDTLEAEASAANRSTPFFMAHGTADPMVPVARGRAARDRLLALGYDVSWHEYRMQHEVCREQIGDLGLWLAERLAPAFA